MLRAIGFLLLLLGGWAQAAIEDVRVMGVTNTQALVAYRAPDANACRVEVSESASYTPVVRDVDATLFAGSDLDSRSTSANRGRDRLVVLGRRTIDKAANGKFYSRALQAATLHYFRVTCGSEQSTVTFQTETIPLGETHTDAYIPDPEFPGYYKYVTVDTATRNFTWIDPHTGVQARLLQNAGDWIEDRPNLAGTVVSSTNWASPEKFVQSTAGQYATFDGASCAGGDCGKMLIQAAEFGAYIIVLTSSDYFKLTVSGFGSSANAEDRQVKVCLVPVVSNVQGTVCDASMGAMTETLTLPQGSEGTVSVQGSFRAVNHSTHLDQFQVSGANPKIRMAIWKANGNGTINIRAAKVSWRGSHKSSVGSGGGHDRCSSVPRPDGRYLCSAYKGGDSNQFYLVHGETGEVTFLGRLNPYISGLSFIYCGADHQPYHFQDPNILYCQPASSSYFGEFTYIGNGQEKPDNYNMQIGVDITYRWLVTDLNNKLKAFYNAHEQEWEEMLGGAGSFYRFSQGGFAGCGITNVQVGFLIGGCHSGSQDTPAWKFILRASDGEVVAMTPIYGTAPARWCSGHTADVYDGKVAVLTLQKFQYKSKLATALKPTDTQITLTSTCTKGCDGFHPGDPVRYDPNANIDFVMPIQVGELLRLNCLSGDASAYTGPCEWIRVTAKTGNTLTIARAQEGTKAISANAGADVYPTCQSMPGSTLKRHYNGSAMWVWDWQADPYGKSRDGSGVWVVPYVGHVVFRTNRSVNNNYTYVTPVGTKILEVDKSMDPDYHRWEPLGFGGQVGTGVGLTYQTHPAANNITENGIGANSFLDAHPFNGGTNLAADRPYCDPNAPAYDVNPATGCPVARVPGYSKVYRYVTSAFPLQRKHYDTFATAGIYGFRDVSGPNCVINDDTPFVFGVVVAAGECVPGSTPGQIYLSTPQKITKYGCYAGESYSFSAPTDVCLGNNEWLNSGVTQTLYGVRHNRWGMKDWPGLNMANYLPRASGAAEVRLLARHSVAAVYRHMPGYSTAHALANGKYALFDWSHITEGSRVGVMRIPPLQLDSVNRSTFTPVIEDISWVPSGTQNALIEFGYSEYWEPGEFRCTTRAEACVAHRSAVNEPNPFSFAQTESYTGVACAEGCRIAIPAYPGRVVYYRTVFRNASNQVIMRGPMRAVATP